MKDKPIVELKNVSKIYKMGDVEVKAVNDVSLEIYPKEFVAIMGASGSGKSTMMHLIGALDLPTKGEIYIKKQKLNKFTENQLSNLRGKTIGFVFQDFYLISTLTALENVRLPILFQENDETEEEYNKRCINLLEIVGLQDRINHKQTELSGGQQQRVAIARALANDPEIILGDEPTGALDSKSSKEIINLFKKLNNIGKTIIIITHDLNVAKNAKRIITLKDGKIIEDKKNKPE
ncbi:ABC transporter ATP-binding protein [archaeon]|nr:ABC transporter ATP-binding protein [archaeon]NCP79150.1 ABC transporter ATP-binding protein [archaeon]NCP97903.1 ABC transporter ATP-binding protein [archaeon]NCQ06917.1 ABC transporter ATP-binding protein [archaeon]NCQ50713.1 ABC transporter ATP-binding protein [archaeon]